MLDHDAVTLARDPLSGPAGDRAAASLAAKLGTRIRKRRPDLSAWELLEDAAELLGVQRIETLRTLRSSGELRRVADGFVVRLREGESEGRRHFTFAHELGHVYMPGSSHEPTDVIERRCNAFAAELLMPRRAFARRAQEIMKHGTASPVGELCDEFAVSAETVVRRLADTDALTGSMRIIAFLEKRGGTWVATAWAMDKGTYFVTNFAEYETAMAIQAHAHLGTPQPARVKARDARTRGALLKWVSVQSEQIRYDAIVGQITPHWG